MRRQFVRVSGLIVATGLAIGLAWAGPEYLPGIEWPEPKLVATGDIGAPPSDAIVLFDGQSLEAWHGGDKWKIANGVATAFKTGLTSKQPFGDCQMHLEWATPTTIKGSGQGRGNSGIYFMNRYEVQILDSWQNPTYFDGQAAAIYKQHPPLVNASKKPGEWQTYDIVFEAPRFDAAGKLAKPAVVTVFHNGVLVQNHFELIGETNYDKPAEYKGHKEKEPMHIQFHGNPVQFRNIWLREIVPMEGKRVREPSYRK